VRGVLRAFDLFVQTSKFEPYGVAVLEAKAAGRPVIATDVNEMREIVTPGVSGLLVAPGNVEALSAAILALVRDRTMTAALGERSLSEARERYSLQAMVARYQQLYDEVRGVEADALAA